MILNQICKTKNWQILQENFNKEVSILCIMLELQLYGNQFFETAQISGDSRRQSGIILDIDSAFATAYVGLMVVLAILSNNCAIMEEV